MGMTEQTGLAWTEGPPDPEGLYELYGSLGWNEFLGLDASALAAAMAGSWLCVNVRLGTRLVGTGRIVSDGAINAWLCGVGVAPDLRGRGIGSGIVERLASRARAAGLHLQLMAEDDKVPYYEARGWVRFAVGMKAERPRA